MRFGLLGAVLLTTLACAGTGRGAPGGRTFHAFTVKDAARRGAVCNNGDPAPYFVMPGVGPDADKWIVWLQGGGSCGTVAACRERLVDQAYRMTGRAAGPPPRGIFDPDPKANPHFHGWTKVALGYCSSDLWFGDREASPDTGGFHFRGYRIVEAVLEDVKASTHPKAPDLTRAAMVLLGGGSAGGAGARNNLDRVAEMLPGVPVRGFVDSAMSLPGPEAYTPANRRIHEAELALWGARPDTSCAAATGGDPLPCLIAPHLEPHLSTPVFLFADQRDPQKSEPDAAGAEADLEAYGAALRAWLSTREGAFSPRLGVHVFADKPAFHTHRIPDSEGRPRSCAETLHAWLEGERPARAVAQP